MTSSCWTTSGEYWLDGVEVARLGRDSLARVRNRTLGFVFQSFNLLARTRVAIARALVSKPRVILADESTGNLDSRTTVEVMALFQELRDDGLTASVSANGVGTTPIDQDFALTGQVGLSWPLFEGLRTRAEVREAQATLRGVQAQQDALRQQVRLEVEQALLGVRAARESLSATEAAVTNARARLRLAEGRYREGVGNISERGDAQLDATNAAAQRVQAEYNLATARARLERAMLFESSPWGDRQTSDSFQTPRGAEFAWSSNRDGFRQEHASSLPGRDHTGCMEAGGPSSPGRLRGASGVVAHRRGARVGGAGAPDRVSCWVSIDGGLLVHVG